MRQLQSYKVPEFTSSRIRGVEPVEGETIETKVMRIMDNKEPITDGAPLLFTEKSEGVVAAYNIRTDRWEVAAGAMDAVSKSRIAQSDGRPQEKTSEKGSAEGSGEVGKAESTAGKEGS